MKKLSERIKFIEENFVLAISETPEVGRDIEFVPRWRCTDIIPGRYTTKGYYGEDRLWEGSFDVSRWRYVDE